ncbi:hypothetical protein A9P82_14995 [Arachidicoccus ginsenosidimutans]|uniref:DUF4476 domain-containing protein n=1 Tax=Arachidicoccus sp. BS20 TaxID=1850526 RepID=UPI0007F0BCD2|nr:DUF4476 domain-containing protein [Arachidicoccus sp. BS20]ANI90478.1 hypothetical protein A9P82_14995 [Arachidicoccus sp. BS20]
MNYTLLKKIILSLVVFLCAFDFAAHAQDVNSNHFIYIQAKSKQPFYVILNSKVYSSSTIGYLIIPKLKNGSYNLRIGFPKQSAPEQNFTCVVNNADVGYSLQKNDEGNLGLLDLQSRKFVASGGVTTLEDQYIGTNTAETNTASANPQQNSTQTSSAFGDMLSSAANDSTLNKPAVAATPKAVMSAPVEKTVADNFGKNPQEDTKAVIAASTDSNLKAGDLGDTNETYGVIKSSETNSGGSQQMTFVLFNTRSTDTVQIVIPGKVSAQPQTANASGDNEDESSSSKTEQSNNNSLALFTNTDSGDTVESSNTPSKHQKRNKKQREENLLNMEANSDAAGDTSKDVNNPFYKKDNTDIKSADDNIASQSIETSAAATPCDNPVSDKELAKLQKKMIGKSNDDAMLALVDKSLKGKCITTQQVKQLGTLFLSDAGRFALYQDVYGNVSDKENYASLKSQLLDNYFKKRFTDMLNQ